MSAFKKVVGLAAGVSAVTVIGFAVAQSVPPNPFNKSGSEGVGSQTVTGTLIGETGVLAEVPAVQAVATLTKQEQTAAVTPAQPAEPVAQAPAPETNVAQANTLPPPSNTNELGAGPAPKAPKHDRG
jgi:hypothetical protein